MTQQDPYAGLSPQEALSQYWDIMTPVHQEMANMGFAPIPQPRYTYPTVDPKDLQRYNNTELGELLSRVTGWLNYAVDRLAYVKAGLIGINREMHQLMILLKQEVGIPKNPTTGKPMSLVDRTELAEQNARHQQLTKHKAILEAEEHLLNSKKASYGEDKFMVSRVISLRIDVNEADRAVHGLPHRGTYPPGNTAGMR